VDRDNPDLAARAMAVDATRAAGRPTVPSTMAEERAANPFLRADQKALADAVGLPGGDPPRSRGDPPAQGQLLALPTSRKPPS